MSYLETAGQWERFWTSTATRCWAAREPLTFEGHGLGLGAHEGEIAGRPAVYPYHQQPIRGSWLSEVPRRARRSARRHGHRRR